MNEFNESGAWKSSKRSRGMRFAYANRKEMRDENIPGGSYAETCFVADVSCGLVDSCVVAGESLGGVEVQWPAFDPGMVWTELAYRTGTRISRGNRNEVVV